MDTASGNKALAGMVINETALAGVSESVRGWLREYAEVVRQLAAGNLAGLTIFGDVLGREFEASPAAAASVVVLQRIDLGLLRRLAEYGPVLGKRRIAAPLTMTPPYVKASLDTFPLELLEIAQRHATLCGEDFFKGLTFQREHVRLQCEREFKRISIHLRHHLLAAAGREKLLGEAVVETGRHLLRTLRGLLWLRGAPDWQPTEATLAAVEKLAGQALGGVRAAVHPHGMHGWADFEALYQDAERLAGVADEL